MTSIFLFRSLYHKAIIRFGLLCKFFGDFWVYLGINSFSQRISEFYGNRKIWRFDVVLKLKDKRRWRIRKHALLKNYIHIKRWCITSHFVEILAMLPSGSVHTDAASFLPLSLPSTRSCCHENRAFRKCTSNRKDLSTQAFRFSSDSCCW